jgi:hypothetical protein
LFVLNDIDIKMLKKSCLDGTRILPTALLDVYKIKEKATIEIKQSDENFECKKRLSFKSVRILL